MNESKTFLHASYSNNNRKLKWIALKNQWQAKGTQVNSMFTGILDLLWFQINFVFSLA